MKSTQIQAQRAKLFHVQTNTLIDLPPDRSEIHLGKPNERIPPDIDVSELPNSHVVSRVHLKISVERGRYYFIEDLGSSNGTYLNHTLLKPQERRQLKLKDRIDLGKEDGITFVFRPDL
jgi:pSer/pThr/pTyr-binding forkhead associated (FHA) protein